MRGIEVVKKETQEPSRKGETAAAAELRRGKDYSGKNLSPEEKISLAHCLLNPDDFPLRDLVNFSDGLALILSCQDGDAEGWGNFAGAVANPLRSIVDKAKNAIGEMELAHSAMGDVLKTLKQ